MCPPSWDGETPGEKKFFLIAASILLLIAVAVLTLLGISYEDVARAVLGPR